MTDREGKLAPCVQQRQNPLLRDELSNKEHRAKRAVIAPVFTTHAGLSRWLEGLHIQAPRTALDPFPNPNTSQVTIGILAECKPKIRTAVSPATDLSGGPTQVTSGVGRIFDDEGQPKTENVLQGPSQQHLRGVAKHDDVGS